MRVEADVLGFPSLIVRAVSVDVKQHLKKNETMTQELCESRNRRPGLPVPNSPSGPCGRKATLKLSCVKVEVAVLAPRP